jgi:hypothetical protein
MGLAHASKVIQEKNLLFTMAYGLNPIVRRQNLTQLWLIRPLSSQTIEGGNVCRCVLPSEPTYFP